MHHQTNKDECHELFRNEMIYYSLNERDFTPKILPDIIIGIVNMTKLKSIILFPLIVTFFALAKVAASPPPMRKIYVMMIDSLVV